MSKIEIKDIQVGECYWVDHRIMLITQEITDIENQTSFLQKIKGKPLFKMTWLIAELDHHICLYDKDFAEDSIRRVTDEDICKELARQTAHYKLTDELNMWVPDYEGTGINLSKPEQGHLIALSYDDLIILKEKIDQILG